MVFDHKHCAYSLTRISLGLIFLFYGLGKFMMGPSTFAEGLVGQFSNTPLPAQLVRTFGLVLPFLEVIIGLLVTLGLFTLAGLSLASLLLMGLTFGAIMLQQPQIVAQNLIFSLTTFFLLFYLEFNAYAVEHLIGGRTIRREHDIPGATGTHVMPRG